MTPKRQVRTVAVYARRSEKKEGRGSVPGQLRRCRQFAHDEGWATREFQDDGESGWSPRVHREGYAAMLDAIGAGEVDAVVIDRADRLTRQDEERAEFERLYKRVGLRMIYLSNGKQFDLGTADGKRDFREAGTSSAYYSDLLSERVSNAQEELAADGAWFGAGRPFGYRIVKDDPDNPKRPRLVPDPEEAPILRELYGAVIDGASLKGLARDLNQRGIRTARGNAWTTTSLRQTLLAPRNAGLRLFRGGTQDENGRDRVAAWKPIVDRRTWRRAHAILTDPSRTVTSRGTRYLLGGLVFCAEHGTRMQGRPVSRERYYDCPTGHHVAIRARALEDHVFERCNEHELPGATDVPDPATLQGPILDELAGVEDRLAEWARLNALGERTDVEYEAARGALVARRAKLARQLDEARPLTPLDQYEEPWERLVFRGSGDPDQWARNLFEVMVARVLVRSAGGRGRWSRVEDRITIEWREGVRESTPKEIAEAAALGQGP